MVYIKREAFIYSNPTAKLIRDERKAAFNHNIEGWIDAEMNVIASIANKESWKESIGIIWKNLVRKHVNSKIVILKCIYRMRCNEYVPSFFCFHVS